MHVAAFHTFAIETFIPLIEELFENEYSIFICPIKNIFGITIMGKSDAIAAHLIFNNSESVLPCFIKRRRSEWSKICMQTDTIYINAFSIHQQTAIG